MRQGPASFFTLALGWAVAACIEPEEAFPPVRSGTDPTAAGRALDGRGGADDAADALIEFAKACDAGSAEACVYLGLHYAHRSGVERDGAKATALFERACTSGVAAGCNNAGTMYQTGHGVPVDLAKARARFGAACTANDTAGCQNLATFAPERVRRLPRPPIRMELGGDIGYGTEPFPCGACGGPDSMGFGFGGHAALAVGVVHLGASFRYFLGGSISRPDKCETPPYICTTTLSEHALQVGLELGYQLSLVKGLVVLRPYLWAGPTVYFSSYGLSDTRFSFAPALALHFRVYGPWFIGGDFRYTLVFPGGDYPEPLRSQVSLFGSTGLAISL